MQSSLLISRLCCTSVWSRCSVQFTRVHAYTRIQFQGGKKNKSGNKFQTGSSNQVAQWVRSFPFSFRGSSFSAAYQEVHQCQRSSSLDMEHLTSICQSDGFLSFRHWWLLCSRFLRLHSDTTAHLWKELPARAISGSLYDRVPALTGWILKLILPVEALNNERREQERRSFPRFSTVNPYISIKFIIQTLLEFQFRLVPTLEVIWKCYEVQADCRHDLCKMSLVCIQTCLTCLCMCKRAVLGDVTAPYRYDYL